MVMGMIKGIGTDLIELDRVRKAADAHGEEFAERIFTPGELAYCRRLSDPVPCLAARFAAKEAAVKALGTGVSGGVSWRDVEVTRSDSGAPGIVFNGRAAEIAADLGVKTVHLSLSHARDYAAAFVVLES